MPRWFHGRTARTRTFDYRYVGGEAAHDQEGPGFYFTTDPEEARRYAHPSGVVLSAELTVPKWVPTTGRAPTPATIERLMRASPCYREVLEDWDEHPVRAHQQALRAFANTGEPPHEMFQRVWADFYLRCGRSADYLRALVKLGYGGVIVAHPAGPYVAARQHAVVFGPEFIRDVRVEEDRGSGPVAGLGLFRLQGRG